MSFSKRSRILLGVRLFLFSTLLAVSTSALEPITTEGRINRNAYPLARYGSKYTALDKGVESELRARIAQVLTPIRLAPASWFRATLGTAPSAPDRRKIIESYAETEIWKCIGESCAGCPGNETSGCVLGNSVAGGIGVVALIHPCLYGEGKCPKGASSDLGAWLEKFAVNVAYFKSGSPKDGAAMRKAAKSSADWLAKTSRAVNFMLGACPGPYSSESLKFLFELEAVTRPNPAIFRCGQKYLEELRELPARCGSIRATYESEWTAFAKSRLRGSIDILRCDPYCQKMLCRAKDSGAFLTAFSGKAAVLLGDGACEGESPKMRGRFLREAIPREMRTKLDAAGCLPALEPAGTPPSGPDIQLVE